MLFRSGDLVPSMLLIPAGELQMGWNQIPYWTLVYEMVFYVAVFATLLLAGRRHYDAFLVVWTGIIVSVNLFRVPFDPMTANFFDVATGSTCLFFIAGATLARLHAGRSWPLVLIVILVFLPMFRLQSSMAIVASIAPEALALAAIVHLFVLLEKRFAPPKWLVAAGDASYGLYLLHLPAVVALTFSLPVFRPFSLYVLIVMLLSGAAGMAFGWLEYSLYKRIRHHIDAAFKIRVAQRAPAWLQADIRPVPASMPHSPTP